MIYKQFLLSKILKTGDCWLWLGAVHKDGYGRVRTEDSFGRHRSRTTAHRAMYEEFIGPLADGLVLDHLCRIRKCVNPEHLEPVTGKVNILRGEAPAAVNARKTHCSKGHPFDALHGAGNGKKCRVCRQCAAAKARRLRAA